MRVIVTGATSFLAKAFIGKLEELNRRPLSDGRESAGAEAENAGTEAETAGAEDETEGSGRKGAGGRTDSAAFEPFEIISFRHGTDEEPKRLPERADAFVHFAWAGVGSAGRSDKQTQAYNIEMSMAALQTAASLGCTRFLFAGSQAEYGRAHGPDGKQHEDGPCFPQSEYGKAKLSFGQRASRWAASLNEDDVPERFRFIHMRIFSVYGPGDHETSLISTCIRKFSADAPAEFGGCTQDWDYLYIDDAAEAIAALLISEDAEGIYNIGAGESRPLREYISEIHELLKSSSEMRFGVRGDNAEGAVSLRPSVEKLNALCGFSPRVNFAEGIVRTKAFSERQSGSLPRADEQTNG